MNKIVLDGNRDHGRSYRPRSGSETPVVVGLLLTRCCEIPIIAIKLIDSIDPDMSGMGPDMKIVHGCTLQA